jgi:hypothetical protein
MIEESKRGDLKNFVWQTAIEMRIDWVLEMMTWVGERGTQTRDKERISCIFPVELQTNCPSIIQGGCFSIV